MDVINKCISGLFMLIVLAAPGNCLAQKKPDAQSIQRPPFYFDKPITLDSLTKYVHSRSKIRFSFNSSKVKGDKVIYLKKGTYSIELLLQQIQKNTSLYYSIYNGYVIFQDNPPKQKISPRPVVKKNKTKPLPRKANTLSHHKPVANSNKQENTAKPAVEIKRLSVYNSPSADTIKILAHSSPDSLIRASLIDSGVHVDTPVKYDRQAIQDTMTSNPLVNPATISTKKERSTTNGLRNKWSDKAGNKKTGLHWQYGLHWKAAIPLYGFDHYFTGPNNRSQPYNLLLPGIWLSARSNDKHEVLLLVKPAEWYLFNNAAFRNDTGFQRIGVDTGRVVRNSRLVKTGGWYAGLQYNFHINEKWMVGAGIGYHLRGRSLILQQTNRLFDKVRLSDSLYSVKNDTLTSKYLNRSIITGKFEIVYSLKSVDVGTTLLLPLTNMFTSQSKNQSRPLNVQLFVRWRIKRLLDD